MNERVMKLTPEEIMVISNQLKYLMDTINIPNSK
jgi:hypothetical protein